ncbi:urease accessory protein [Microvirga sp. KLBC 81]|uniref:HupE/UreJ family protein n=1 Tax=Microvirga sp. KLBC 81 TaxID=1862707 RepID=UPI000D511945|nr:HupE/UreJ family protein [Microvirga sp. KLBC 81]PVE22024.1 urease accessory protein [Microvirga sp. KLBC 81]
MRPVRSILAITIIAITTPSLAHTEQHHFSGFAAGLSHPFAGLDHVLAMVSVGLLAALTGGRAAWAMPAGFIAMMLMGGAMGMMEMNIPAVEAGIAASITILGALIAWGHSWHPAAATALAGSFALFHGYAHGIEIPEGSGVLSYGVGFALASLALHLLGLAMGAGLARQSPASRISGVAVTLAGLWVAFG